MRRRTTCARSRSRDTSSRKRKRPPFRPRRTGCPTARSTSGRAANRSKLRAGNVIRSRWAFLTSTWGERGARLFAAAVVVSHAVAAWFNAGFLSADEHYQIIEFAQYKLGRQSAAALAWEFPAQMRPALQPWFAAMAIRLHHALGATSPFTIAFSLRLLSTIIATIV